MTGPTEHQDAFAPDRSRVLIVTAIVMVFQAWVTLSHDAWLDEWQAMLLATQSADLATLLKNLHYEGHPPLWYLLLRALGSGIQPALALNLAALACALSTVAIVMIRSPFVVRDRVLLCCGYLLLVEYGSLSRGIGVGIAMLFAFMAFPNKRLRWAILALLPLVEVQLAVLAVAGMAMMWRDRQWSWTGVVLVMASLVAMVMLVWPAPDVHNAATLQPTYVLRLAQTLMVAGNLLVPLPLADGMIMWFGNVPGMMSAVFAVAFGILGWNETRGDRWHRALFFGFVAFTLMMAVFVYPQSMRHLGLVAIVLILLVWRSAAAGCQPSRYFVTWLAVSALCGTIVAGHIAQVGFDGSGAAARKISALGLPGKLWATLDDPHAVPVTARLTVPNYNMARRCSQTFIRWDQTIQAWTDERVATALSDTAARFGQFYVVSNRIIETVPGLPVTLLYSAPRGYTSWDYHLYRIGRDGTSTGVAPPACRY